MSTVVIIDDSQSSLSIIGSVFRQAEWEVESFTDSDQALERLNNGGPVDLVVSDILMNHHLDGITLARRLEGKFPVVLITADQDLQNEANGYNMPCMLKGNFESIEKIWNFYHMAKKKFQSERNALDLQYSVNALQISQNEIQSDLKLITHNFGEFSETIKEMGHIIQEMSFSKEHFVQKEEMENIIEVYKQEIKTEIKTEIHEQVQNPIITSPEHFNMFFNSFVINARKNVIVMMLIGTFSLFTYYGGSYIKTEYKNLKENMITKQNFEIIHSKIVQKLSKEK